MAEAEKSEQDDEQGGSDQSTSEYLIAMMKKQLGLDDEEEKLPENVEKLLEDISIEAVARYMLSGKCKNVVTMAGAGISTSAGIPDFRSPGTGLYHSLAKYDLPYPHAIFEIDYFIRHPEPFFMLAKNLYPGLFKPTPCHYFIRLLHEKGLLLRHYTQNIDTLERVAGVEGDKIVEAHGTFHSAHCLDCRATYTQDWVKEKVFADTVPRCTSEGCDGIVKPDIVFFGEALPERFFRCAQSDLSKCDLLIIMGTSLVVHPFASLTDRVPDTTPRLYINLEKASGSGGMSALFGQGHGFRFDKKNNYRDVFWQGTCDDGCYALAKLLGWEDDLHSIVTKEHARIIAESDTNQTTAASSSSAQSDVPSESPVAELEKKLADAQVSDNDNDGAKTSKI